MTERSAGAAADARATEYADRMYAGGGRYDHETDEWLEWATCLEHFRDGYTAGVAAERSAIVGWLRSMGERSAFAAAIERGEHEDAPAGVTGASPEGEERS